MLIREAKPYNDMTTAYPPVHTTLSGICNANCTYSVIHVPTWTWSKVTTFDVVTTIVHAIEYVITNKQKNTTTTSTSYPQSGLSINSEGTRTYEIKVTKPVGEDGRWRVFTTAITYPSQYTAPDLGYTWWGEVPTTVSGGASVCSWAPYYASRVTANQPTGTIFSMVASGAVVSYVTLQPLAQETQDLDPDDPSGMSWILEEITASRTASIPSPYNEGAVPRLCTLGKPQPPDISPPPDIGNFLPGVALTSTSLITQTSTLSEDTPLSAAASASDARKQSQMQQGGDISAPVQTRIESPPTASSTTVVLTAHTILDASLSQASSFPVGSVGFDSTTSTSSPVESLAVSPPTSEVGTVQSPGAETRQSTILPPSTRIVEWQTVDVGGASKTVGGEVVGLRTNEYGKTEVVIGETTITLDASASASSGLATTPTGDSGASATLDGGVVVGGETLAPGETETLGGGETVGVQMGTSSVTGVVVDGSTVTLLPESSTALGWIILVGIGATTSNQASSHRTATAPSTTAGVNAIRVDTGVVWVMFIGTVVLLAET